MSTKKTLLLTTLLAIFWTSTIVGLLLTQAANHLLGLSFISLAALLVILIRGTSKFSSLTGKVLIAMSVLVIVSYIIGSEQITLDINSIVPIATLATGLYIERINPHRKLYPWMFLGIATKVQAILISALPATGVDIHTVLDIRWWWLIVACMAAGVLLLVIHKFYWYRGLVIFVTITGLILAGDIILNNTWNLYPLGIALLAFLWPMIMMRAVGRKILLKNQ